MVPAAAVPGRRHVPADAERAGQGDQLRPAAAVDQILGRLRLNGPREFRRQQLHLRIAGDHRRREPGLGHHRGLLFGTDEQVLDRHLGRVAALQVAVEPDAPFGVAVGPGVVLVAAATGGQHDDFVAAGRRPHRGDRAGGQVAKVGQVVGRHVDAGELAPAVAEYATRGADQDRQVRASADAEVPRPAAADQFDRVSTGVQVQAGQTAERVLGRVGRRRGGPVDERFAAAGDVVDQQPQARGRPPARGEQASLGGDQHLLTPLQVERPLQDDLAVAGDPHVGGQRRVGRRPGGLAGRRGVGGRGDEEGGQDDRRHRCRPEIGASPGGTTGKEVGRHVRDRVGVGWGEREQSIAPENGWSMSKSGGRTGASAVAFRRWFGAARPGHPRAAERYTVGGHSDGRRRKRSAVRRRRRTGSGRR